jgi:hypothetical protein
MRSTIAALKADIQKIKSEISPPQEPHIIFDETGLRFKLNHPMAEQYDPFANSEVGTFENFHNSDAKFNLLMGGFGSGKTTACIADILIKLYHMPQMKDGVRRAKWIAVRNTMGELKSTLLKSWDTWFNNDDYAMYLGEKPHIIQKPNLIYQHVYYDNKGRCELELFCIGLDSEKAKSRLESIEATNGLVGEAQHIPRGVITHLIGRTGRYPKKGSTIKEYFACVIADTNPPSVTHWMHKDFESKDKIEGNRIFHQPPGLIKDHNGNWINNIRCDNAKHLRKNYYYEMARAEGFSEAYIKTICNGEYGFSKEGKPVYSEYNDDIHSTDNVDIIDDLPVIIGVDGGSTPAALISQFTFEGQQRCIKEFVTHFSSARTLKENHVLPWVRKHLDGYKILIVHDPSMIKSNENVEVSAAEIWEDPEVWEVLPAKSNIIDRRIEAQKDYLNKMVDGKPKFLLSRNGCPTLREAMISKYCYVEVKGKNEGTFKDIPDKTHPHSDIADCGQYVALENAGEGLRINNESDVDLSEFTEASLSSGWV